MEKSEFRIRLPGRKGKKIIKKQAYGIRLVFLF